jgi:hypothetical protein
MDVKYLPAISLYQSYTLKDLCGQADTFIRKFDPFLELVEHDHGQDELKGQCNDDDLYHITTSR